MSVQMTDNVRTAQRPKLATRHSFSIVKDLSPSVLQCSGSHTTLISTPLADAAAGAPVRAGFGNFITIHYSLFTIH